MRIKQWIQAMAWVAGCSALSGQVMAADVVLPKIKNFVVIYLENRSFDHLYGDFPGANNRSKASAESLTQKDANGTPYTVLPRVLISEYPNPPVPDKRFPESLPNKPYEIGQYVKPEVNTGDQVHNFYNSIRQMNGGAMDRFVAYCDAQALTFGYYDTSKMRLTQWAKDYVLADNFFQGAFGGSFLAHQWLIAARTPFYENAPAELKTELDADGKLIKERALTPDGYAINTIMPTQLPTDPKRSKLPVQDYPNIGDRLTEKGISWAWYSGGWNDAVAGKADPTFQYHHQPFVYFKNYGENTPGRSHLKDYADLLQALKDNNLPQVVFYKPLGKLNQHSGYSNIADADKHVHMLLRALQSSKQWQDMAIIITYDEFGGYWDHVAPPKVDKWGPGPRIPALIISPHAKKGFIDSTEYNTTSILATLERHFDLAPLTDRDAKANDLRNAFLP